jgi:hypothetical protein
MDTKEMNKNGEKIEDKKTVNISSNTSNQTE